MDARIDVFAVLGLERGDAHIIRNAGARVTEDALRSLAVSSHLLGVDTVVVMEHTDCGATQRSNEQFQALTGLAIDFYAIEDHKEALRHDIEQIAAARFLSTIKEAAGLLFDVETCVATEVVRWVRGD
jgi:carbonic anhydrase